jgi:hypothetical protein
MLILRGSFSPESSYRAIAGTASAGLFAYAHAHFAVPNDCLLADTMMRAGVRFTMIPDVVSDLYPSKLHS